MQRIEALMSQWGKKKVVKANPAVNGGNSLQKKLKRKTTKMISNA